MSTEEEWYIWKKSAKAKKNRYWLAEKGLDFLQNFVYWPLDLIRNIHHYLDNRWICKTHALTSNLKRGRWHEFDTRLLHALFDELVNFVEIEQAGQFMAASEEESRKYKIPWYRKIFHLGMQRCPEAGLAYLEWAASLKKDEDWVDKEDSSFGQPTSQALAAKQIITLYRWWKIERPRRPDPMDASGWSIYCEERCQAAKAENDDLSWMYSRDEVDRKRSSQILQTSHEMEQKQEDEDTEMLIRLIKIRSNLWT
jgi:hypothetical protein